MTSAEMLPPSRLQRRRSCGELIESFGIEIGDELSELLLEGRQGQVEAARALGPKSAGRFDGEMATSRS